MSGTILLAATASAAAQTADPVGEWLVEDGSARIKVVSCPQGPNQPPTLWGVIWAETSPGRDTANPDPSMRNRPMLGVPILINMRQSESNLWNGKIYDARGGSIYDAKISLNRKDMLEVRGCVASIFCGGQDWRRITDPKTPPVPTTAATPAAPQAKSGAMAQSQQTKGAAMSKGASSAPAAAADPICSNVSSLVPRT
ncbi:DUF2147 domain-containing protein [Bradyrhizobium sp. LHD-71]|uniref:DUF2147 domain-containing protein n=1 Tax=Bradyrhizobium sp. LHD-71 TaxID=3072141 RepID=UPI00280DAF6A|nr:DUF2147 domain-containing protein [Bradyrhizobium sp. LHD-71]MDQ8727739.1 DUF2147 domain-containing protein [Bradyrhizobium sp. LHD-71]